MHTSTSLPLAIKVFKDYWACPCCSDGKNVVNLAAVYHISALTHAEYICKDCNNQFLVPSEVKIKPMKPFNRNREVRNG